MDKEKLECNIIYLAKQDGKTIGFLMVFNWGNKKNYVKITNIIAKECFRGQKIAQKLIETKISERKEEGMKDFRAETRVTNYPMQKVFSNFGFKNVRTIKDYYDNPTEDALRYGLYL